MNNEGTIIKVSGPLVIASGMSNAKMFDLARVGDKNLIGEIVELRGDVASIQVYEDTSGVGPGEKAVSIGEPLSVELGPGLMASIYDGIQRPLDVIRKESGDYIPRGLDVPKISRTKKWFFEAKLKEGDTVKPGDVVGTVQETDVVLHKIMIPDEVSGTIKKIGSGEFTVEETVAEIQTKTELKKLNLIQKWPVRTPRIYKEKLLPEMPLITGQRVIDAFFPIAKGGTACVPGPFGSGKTIVQHQLAKWADADIIVYIGCGERGNEMTSVLMEFPELKDPRTGGPLINRTVLIANTSNMPVAAREASIYTGITIAEYYRDMGFNVATMADSTSRWAEALREMSGRLEEMPGEEGYPAYLPAKIADFYERAGRVKCLGKDNREGTLSIVGAVSPPGGDLSDPVVQATLKVVKVFWSLEDWLAYERHFPAINWLTSYSLYHDNLSSYFQDEFGDKWANLRQEAMTILQQESDLKEITRLVGIDAVSHQDRIVLETSKSIREDFLHQNAFDDVDTYTSFAKQFKMLDALMVFHNKAIEAINKGALLNEILSMKVREKISRMKYVPEDKLTEFNSIYQEIDDEFSKVIKGENKNA